MVVTAANIPLVSEYSVSDSGAFTTTIFNGLFADAKEYLDEDDPGLSTTQYDRAHALLICHLFEMRNPDAAYSSMSSGGISGSRVPGTSSFSIQYFEMIGRGASRSLPEEQADIRRCDVDMGDMALDQNTMQEFFTL